MRQAFINTLIELAETDKDLYLLTADMGFGLVEQFATRFPKQYINVGVAEQNMIGVAAGLALEGKKVFCYSIGNFPTMRCLEQIRNDVCYHNLPVCIVSGGAGLWYGALGMTHHAVEDIAIMRCLPNMAVVSPCNATETSKAVEAVYQRNSPGYLRMSRTTEYRYPQHYQFGKADIVFDNPYSAVAVLATGGQMIDNAVRAVAQLEHYGTTSRLLNIHTIKPLDWQTILDTVDGVKLVITIEEHSRIGGLGSAVAEVLAGLRQHPPLVRLGTADCYPATAMSYEELLKANHLDVDSIVQEVLDAIS
jgi:transketolase